jgi:hypothetical protein
MLEKGLAPFGIQNRTPSAASEAKVRALIVELTIANVIAYSDKNEWSRVHQTPADGFKYEYGALKASNNIVKQLASHYDASEDELIATLNLANELGLINKRENLVAF